MSNNSSLNIFTLVHTTPSHILITIVSIIFVILIAFGNTLTLIAITKFRNLRHQSSVMIGFLALADLWMGVVYTPVQLLKIHMPVLFQLRIPCLIFLYTGHFAAIAAVTFLSLLSLERVYAVQFPFHYHAHSGIKLAVIVNVGTFVYLKICLIPMVAGVANWYEGAYCYAPTLCPSFYSRFLVAMTLTPMCMGFIAFIRVSVLEFRYKKQILDQTAASLRKQESIRTKLMLTAYIISLCFWTPHLLYYLYASISKADKLMYLFRVVSLLDLGSSAVNCFLYAWKNSKFKAAYKELLCLSSSDAQRSSIEETGVN